MKTINQNTRYTEAKNTLDALSAAFNAATAEESSAAGEELAAQSQILKEEVRRFRLKNR